MRSLTALVYGAVNPDIVHRVERLPGPGDDIRSTAWSTNWGGKAANAAMALATWGVSTRLLGLPVGLDALGELLLDTLDIPTLERSWLARTDAPTRHCLVLVTPDGDRSIVCTGYEGADWQEVPESAWRGVDVAVIDGFGGAAAAAVATAASAQGIPAVWLDAPDPLPVEVDLVVWSRHEHHASDATRTASHRTAVVLTSGPGPVHAWWRDAGHFETVPPHIAAVDATGSGDVFAAACGYGLASGWPPQRIVRFAAAAGAAAAARPRSELPSFAAVASLIGGDAPGERR